MNDLPDDISFRPRCRKLRFAAAAIAALAALAGIGALLNLAPAPQLAPTEPIETERSAPALDEFFPQPPAPIRMTVATALPEGIPAGARKTARQTLIVRNACGNRGSGFMYRPGILVTAARIANKEDLEKKKLRVRCEPIETDAEVLIVDYLRDVLVARVDCVAVPLKIDGSPYRPDARLFLSGFDFSRDSAERCFKPTVARPLAVFSTDDESIRLHLEQAASKGIHQLQGFDAEIVPGNFGSPVFDAEGVVVGMAVMAEHPRRRSFMVPAASILAALDAAHAR